MQTISKESQRVGYKLLFMRYVVNISLFSSHTPTHFLQRQLAKIRGQFLCLVEENGVRAFVTNTNATETCAQKTAAHSCRPA